MHKSLNVDLYAKEHANMDSLPFRYGFQFPRNQTIELHDIDHWEQQTHDRVKCTASFEDIQGSKQSGTFILMKTESPLLKVVTVWRNDQKSEFYLSELMKNLRKDRKISVADFIELHPRYLSGELVTMAALFDAWCRKKALNCRIIIPILKDQLQQNTRAKYKIYAKKILV